ncbi:BolA family protein [Glaciecola siphonariae]|uniref:BolA family protein n=1 Tax=Glaciecola siphonariae TaxID=521012 RepID=A0ABV9LWD8_9ALTE
MKVQKQIESTLQDALPIQWLNVENESHMHSVPENSETHFKVTVVSQAFETKRLIARHRMINSLLSEQLAGPVHALALHTYTPSEWQEKHGAVPASPNCLGGSKAEQA